MWGMGEFTNRGLGRLAHQSFPSIVKEGKMVQGPPYLESEHGFQSFVGWGTLEQCLTSPQFGTLWNWEPHTWFTNLQGSKEESEHLLENAFWVVKLYRLVDIYDLASVTLTHSFMSSSCFASHCPRNRWKSRILGLLALTVWSGNEPYVCVFSDTSLQEVWRRPGHLESTVVICVSFSLPQSPHCAFKEGWGGRAEPLWWGVMSFPSFSVNQLFRKLTFSPGTHY